jgi:sugar-specific transcriptional regulator TrmB
MNSVYKKQLVGVLQELGLNEKEAMVYLALLSLGEASVSEVAQEAKIKRPTAYLILSSLEEKGLVKINTLLKKTNYLALSPQNLAVQLKRNTDLVKDILPQLLATYNLGKAKGS